MTVPEETAPERVVIVGASVAGIRVAQELRQAGYVGEITVVGEERHPPYDKPPLSKEMLAADSSGEAVPLLPPDQLKALGLDLRLGVRANGLAPGERVISTADGHTLGYDALVVATGSIPRTLPGTPHPALPGAPLDDDHLDGVLMIRTIEDAQRLRADLGAGRRLVVVGGGFIGAEVAAAATAHGTSVTMLEAQAEPMALALGEAVGASIRRMHEAHGVTVLTHARVANLDRADRAEHKVGGGRVTAVILADGARLPCDSVVVGIGARPATDWLDGSGLPVSDGVECDIALRVNGFPDIYAAGDVARWPHPLYVEPIRIEHWTNTGDHARAIAADITRTRPPAPTVPYVWSDQYGHRIQILGRPAIGTPALLVGEAGTGDLFAAYEDESGKLVAAVIVDNPRLMLLCRKAILAGKSLPEVRSQLP